jgi:hypothetical protein
LKPCNGVPVPTEHPGSIANASDNDKVPVDIGDCGVNSALDPSNDMAAALQHPDDVMVRPSAADATTSLGSSVDAKAALKPSYDCTTDTQPSTDAVTVTKTRDCQSADYDLNSIAEQTLADEASLLLDAFNEAKTELAKEMEMGSENGGREERCEVIGTDNSALKDRPGVNDGDLKRHKPDNLGKKVGRAVENRNDIPQKSGVNAEEENVSYLKSHREARSECLVRKEVTTTSNNRPNIDCVAGAHDGIVKAGAQVRIEKAGAQDRIEKAGAQDRIEKAGAQDRIEKAGAQDRIEKAGAQDRIEKAGAQDPIEKAGAKTRVVAWVAEAVVPRESLNVETKCELDKPSSTAKCTKNAPTNAPAALEVSVSTASPIASAAVEAAMSAVSGGKQNPVTASYSPGSKTKLNEESKTKLSDAGADKSNKPALALSYANVAALARHKKVQPKRARPADLEPGALQTSGTGGTESVVAPNGRLGKENLSPTVKKTRLSAYDSRKTTNYRNPERRPRQAESDGWRNNKSQSYGKQVSEYQRKNSELQILSSGTHSDVPQTCTGTNEANGAGDSGVPAKPRWADLVASRRNQGNGGGSSAAVKENGIETASDRARANKMEEKNLKLDLRTKPAGSAARRVMLTEARSAPASVLSAADTRPLRASGNNSIQRPNINRQVAWSATYNERARALYSQDQPFGRPIREPPRPIPRPRTPPRPIPRPRTPSPAEDNCPLTMSSVSERRHGFHLLRSRSTSSSGTFSMDEMAPAGVE